MEPEQVAVDCHFGLTGHVRVSRIASKEGSWTTVEQGRQWVDDAGRHVLVRRRGGPVQELLLERQTLIWQLYETSGSRRQVV